MKDYIFIEESPDHKEVFGFETSLFHHVDHVLLQTPDGWRWFFIKRIKTNTVVASLFLNLSNDKATSAVRSPFGTIECVHDIDPEILFNFIVSVESCLKAKGISYITIRHSPLFYSSRANVLIATFLSNLGYAVTQTDATTSIPIGQHFLEGIDNEKNVALARGKEMGLQYKRLSKDSLYQVYQFIADIKNNKKYTLSIEFDTLKETIERFPDNYLLSGVFQGETLVCASIDVVVQSDILYHFLSDHDPKYDRMSPILMVTDGLYEFCKYEGIRQLDLGTSSLNKNPNFGLLSFKLRIGGLPSPKFTFEKHL